VFYSLTLDFKSSVNVVLTISIFPGRLLLQSNT